MQKKIALIILPECQWVGGTPLRRKSSQTLTAWLDFSFCESVQ